MAMHAPLAVALDPRRTVRARCVPAAAADWQVAALCLGHWAALPSGSNDGGRYGALCPRAPSGAAAAR